MTPSSAGSAPGGSLARRLGTFDAVVLGLGSMLGAGVFAAFAPAAAAAGSWLLVSLGLAAAVAYCNATSSARLAALYPASGGSYVYGRRRLGDFWGYLAGWAFIVGKTASCAAMALTVGVYAWPRQARLVAVAAVLVLTVLNLFGVHRSAQATRVIVAVVLGSLAVVVGASLGADRLDLAGIVPGRPVSVVGVVQGAGLLFFAFAGYARIATLGEEVVDPARTIPRAISIALAVIVAVYAAVIVAVAGVLGLDRLAASSAPLADAVSAAGFHRLTPLVRAGAVAAALGALLALILGVSRTTLAMARDRHLPPVLDAVHPVRQVPHRAEIAVGVVVGVVVLAADLRGAIGFSSVGVLVYYAIANASAATLTRAEGRPPRWVPVCGLVGCLGLAFSLPASAVLAGTGALIVGAAAWAARRLVPD